MHLLELEVKKNNGDKIYDIKFCNLYSKNGPFSTVIIGINGSGKSRLLNTIADVMLCHFQQRKVDSLEYDYYRLKYEINGEINDIVFNKKDKTKRKQIDEDLRSINIKTFATSFIVNDKFPFNANEFYSYMGVRQVSNAIFSNTIDRQIITNILSMHNSAEKINLMKHVFEMIGLDSKCELNLKIKKGVQKSRIRQTTLNTLNRENKKFITPLLEDEKKEIINFIDKLLNIYKGELNIDLFLGKNSTISSKMFAGIASLRNVMHTLKLHKKIGNTSIEFNLGGASSGEKHILFTMLNIINSIQNNSVILIDEPEVSLHPNWQMKYIDTLKKIFANFDIHFIIATHSHFIVSDLEGKTSSVVSLMHENEANFIKSDLLDFDTFAWSPDDILYNIFNVVSSRNKFVAEEIANILHELSMGTHNTENIIKKETYDKLINLKENLKDIDPLKKVVISILNKVDKA